MTRRKRNVIKTWEYRSLSWLAKESKINDLLLADVLTKCREKSLNNKLYHNVTILKRNGDKRIISVPEPNLLKVQKSINKNVLKDLPTHPCAFGFSGGGIVDAIKPHLKNKVLYSFDIVNAFGQIGYEYLRDMLEDNFSLPVTTMLMDLAFWKDKLPQGSAISPRLFDQAFYKTDVRIERLAQKLGGSYSRYADNIFFSVPGSSFSTKLQSAVLRRVSWMTGERIYCHEFSLRRLDKGAVRVLGLNIVNGEISASRDYKRNLRLTLHHMKYLVDHGFSPYYADWSRIQGQMAFASLGFLPSSLLEAYSVLEERIRDM